MGKFRDLDSINIIEKHLEKKDFCLGTGPQGEHGLIKFFKKEDTILWITVNLVEAEIHTYQETVDESFLGSEIYELSYKETTVLNKFLDKMDEIFDRWY